MADTERFGIPNFQSPGAAAWGAAGNLFGALNTPVRYEGGVVADTPSMAATPPQELGEDLPLPPGTGGTPYTPKDTGAPPTPGGAVDPIAEAFRVADSNPGALTPEQHAILQRMSGLGGSYVAPSATATATTSGSSRQRVTGDMLANDAAQDTVRARMTGRAEALAGQQTTYGDAETVAATAEADKLKAWAAERQQLQLQQGEELDTLQRDVTKATSEYKKAASEMDPNRLMKGGKRWLGAFAMALGAYGATLGRTQNFAQQIIDNALARDLEGQKLRVAGKKDEVSFARQIYADHQHRFQNDLAAKAATKADMYEIFGAQARARAAKLKGTEAAASTLQQADHLEQAALAARGQALAARAGQIQSSTTSTTTSQNPGGVVGGAPDYYGQLLQRANTKHKVDEAFGGEGGVTKEDIVHMNKVRERMAVYGDAIVKGKRLRELNTRTNEAGRTVAFSEDAHRQPVAQEQFLSAAYHAETGAAGSKEEILGKTKAYFGGKWTSDSRNIGIDEAMRSARTRVAAELSTLPGPLRDRAIREAVEAGFMSADDVNELMAVQAPAGRTEAGTLGGKTR